MRALLRPSLLVVSMFVGNSFADDGAIFLASFHVPTAAPVRSTFQDAIRHDFEATFSNISWGRVENQAFELQAALKPMFRAMPKNKFGRVGPAGTRYMLHRHFMSRGWSINGVDPAGDAWGSPWHAKVLQDRAPASFQDVLKMELEGSGLDVYNVALIAAVIDALITDSEAEQLKAAYELNNIPLNGTLDADATKAALDLFLAGHVLGESLVGKSKNAAKDVLQTAQEQFVQWSRAQDDIHYAFEEHAGRFSYEQGVQLVSEVSRSFSQWLEPECQAIAKGLTPIEDTTGRVRLGAFYGAALSGSTWQYSESVNYLRSIGALDDSDPQNLKVIIANYVSGPGNCFASSNNYAVCCLDPCQEILGQLEETLKMPSAKPAQLAAAVASLPDAGKNWSTNVSKALPAFMSHRLQHIAKLHAGRVPLHSRLFAEWLHVAFPNTCPYPHLSGTTHARDPLVYTQETGYDWDATEEEMHQHAQAERASCRTREALGMHEHTVVWATEEEVLADVVLADVSLAPKHISEVPRSIHSMPTWRERASFVGLVIGCASMAVGLLWLFTEPVLSALTEPTREVYI